MIKKLLLHLLKVQIRFYPLFLLLAIGVVSVSISPTLELFRNIKTSFSSLLPDDHQATVLSKKINKKREHTRNISLLFEVQNEGDIEELLPKIAEKMRQLEGVVGVNYKKPAYDFLDKHKLYFLPYEELLNLREEIDHRIQREKLKDLFIRFEEEEKDTKTLFSVKNKYLEHFSSNIESPYLTNKEKTIYILSVQIAPEIGDDIKRSKAMLQIFERALQDFNLREIDPNINLYYGGGIRPVVDTYNILMNDLKTAGIFSLIAISLLLFLYLGNPLFSLLLLFPLVIGVVTNFALTQFTIGELNLITAFLFMILFGLGIDIGLHYFTRYREERRKGNDLQTALAMMVISTGRAVWTATTTTGATFLLLFFNEFRGFSDFGLIAGCGLFFIFLSYKIFLPPFIILGEKLKFIAGKEKKSFLFRSHWHPKIRISNPFQISLLLITAIAMLLTVFFSRFEYDLEKLNYKPKAEKLYREKSLKVYPGKTPPAVILARNSEDAQLIKNSVEQKLESGKLPLVRSVTTFSDVIPKEQKKKEKILGEIRQLLEDDFIERIELTEEDRRDLQRVRDSTAARPFTTTDIPFEVRKFFFGEHPTEEEQLVFVSLKPEVRSEYGKDAMDIANQLRSIDTPIGSVSAVNNAVVLGEVLLAMFRDNPRAITITFIVIWFLLWFDFRNLTATFIVFLPLLVGMSWLLGIMAFCEIRWNIFNIVALPVLLGLGIDHNIHLFHRLREEGMLQWPHIFAETGGAIIMTTLTTFAGFGGMLFAHHPGLQSLSLVACIGLMTSMIASFWVLPMLYQLLERRT